MTRKEILTAATECVCTSRQKDYGPVEDNFRLIAGFWDMYTNYRAESGGDITAHDVAIMMCLLKIGRIASGQAKADNYIDLAGYAACAGEIALKEDKHEKE